MNNLYNVYNIRRGKVRIGWFFAPDATTAVQLALKEGRARQVENLTAELVEVPPTADGFEEARKHQGRAGIQISGGGVGTFDSLLFRIKNNIPQPPTVYQWVVEGVLYGDK